MTEAVERGIAAFEAGRATEAREAFAGAALAGEARGMLYLAWMLDRGEGGPADPAEAVRWLGKAAEAGDPEGCHLFARALFTGDGGRLDPDAAMQWQLKAAEGGNVVAQHELGMFCEHGWGMKADLRQAAAWYRKAAESGYPGACEALSRLYADGGGVPADPAASRSWARKALEAYARQAEQGDVISMEILAEAWFRGSDLTGGATDPDAARKWARHASEAGSVSGTLLLARLTADEAARRDLLAPLVARGSVEARYWLEHPDGSEDEALAARAAATAAARAR